MELDDRYADIASRIVVQLDEGATPWHRPWGSPNLFGRVATPLRHDGKHYLGTNLVRLWYAAATKGYRAERWMTPKQAAKLGGTVRDGERGSRVEKGYEVFNAQQIDGLPEPYYFAPETFAPWPQRITCAESFFTSTGIDIQHGGSKACYRPSTDHVQMPPIAAFADSEGYYATLAHECIHWALRPSRLNANVGQGKYIGKHHAREELVAEFGAAFLCADLQISPEPRSSHASYILFYAKTLKADADPLYAAAYLAQRAVTFLHSLQTQSTTRCSIENALGSA